MDILVVDNEIILVESMRIGLQARGYRVIPAYSVQEALGHLFDGGRRIDMVITDYLMPGMTGIDLLAIIRQTDPALPVILMTAYGETNLVMEALRNKCDGFLEKPFRLEQLVEQIEKIQTGFFER